MGYTNDFQTVSIDFGHNIQLQFYTTKSTTKAMLDFYKAGRKFCLVAKNRMHVINCEFVQHISIRDYELTDHSYLVDVEAL